MGLFDKNEPVFLKEGSSAREELAALESLRTSLPPQAQQQIDDEIRVVKAGIAGEDRVLFELKHSHMDMVVLQDLFLEHDDLTAQIDFMVLTRRRYFVIECKNLYGNIEVDSHGNFIRHLGGVKREGIYSPVTQNRRHLELLHAIRRDNHGAAFNFFADQTFDDQYRSLVVLANPKTVLDDRFAPKEVKDQIVRADRLIATIEEINRQQGLGHSKLSLSDVREAGEWLLGLNKPNPVDYTAKYQRLAQAASSESASAAQTASDNVARPAEARAGDAQVCPICGSPLVLRTARCGARAGKKFYGCSAYPKCHFIRNVD